MPPKIDLSRFALLFSCGVPFLVFSAASAQEPTASPRATQLPPEMFSQLATGAPTTFLKADEYFKAGRFDEAATMYDNALKNAFITPRDKSYALCRKGLIQSLQNGFNEAKENLEEALKGNLLPREHFSTCSYALLQIYALQQQNDQALAVIEQLGQPSFDAVYQARVWALGAEVARRKGDTAREVIYLKRLHMIMESKGIKTVALKILGRRVVSEAEVRKRLGLEAVAEPSADPARSAEAGSSNGASASDASRTQQNAPHSSDGRAEKIRKMLEFLSAANLVMQQGNTDEALRRWGAVKERGLSEVIQKAAGFAAPVEKILARLQQIQTGDPKHIRIGVLVPGDPEFAELSFRIMRAASAFMASPAVNGVDLKLFLKTAAADPGAMETASLELILDEQVHAIVGPVSSALTMGALGPSQFFGVPLFALGPVSDPQNLHSPYLVRMGVLSDSQTKALVEHIKGLGLRNAAILAPNDAYGVELARAFARNAENLSLPIEKATFFDADSEVFTLAVEQALGPQDKSARKDEYDALVVQAKRLAQQQRRKFDPSSVKLPVLVRFDALFLPDSLRRARVIASTFAFNDAKNLRFLGDRQWNETENRRSIADEFLNGARLPRALRGRYLGQLLLNLGVSNESGRAPRELPLDLERQVFDALILSRQAHYLAAGVNGAQMVKGMREKQWKLEGTTLISGVSSEGEPITLFGLAGYENGAITDRLPDWVGSEWQERIAKSQSATKQ